MEEVTKKPKKERGQETEKTRLIEQNESKSRADFHLVNSLKEKRATLKCSWDTFVTPLMLLQRILEELQETAALRR